MKVRVKSSPEDVYDGFWLTEDHRLALVTNGKVVTTYPIGDLEVMVNGQWDDLTSAWKARTVMFLILAPTGETNASNHEE